MRDLIFLAQRIPYPPNKGDKIRSFHILRHLAGRFRVHLGCFVDNQDDEKHVEALQSMCQTVFAAPLSGPVMRLRALGALTRGVSFSEACFQDARLSRWVQATVRENHIADGFVFSSAMAPYLMRAPFNKVLDAVDVDSEKWRAYAGKSSWPMSSIYARESRKLFSLETRAVASFDKSIFVSTAEAETFLTLAPEAAERLIALNNGVDTGYFDPSLQYPSPFANDTKAIVFTGTMDYRPNVEAVTYFVRDVFPSILERHPATVFWVVGANPAAAVRDLEHAKNVRVTGQVPDVRPFLAHAGCVVAPLRTARGVQNKVLEAMAMARPVVTTPDAHEGIAAQPGDALLVAASASSFALAVCAVLDGKHPALGNAARAYVLSHHSWQHNLRVLDALFPA